MRRRFGETLRFRAEENRGIFEILAAGAKLFRAEPAHRGVDKFGQASVRFDQDVLWLKEQSSRLGKIIRTKGYGVHTHWGPSGWFTQKKLAGSGALADMGIHALDTVRFLLGDPRPVSVYAKLGSHYGDYDVDDTGLLLVEWENGAASYIESGWWQPKVAGLEPFQAM